MHEKKKKVNMIKYYRSKRNEPEAMNLVLLFVLVYKIWQMLRFPLQRISVTNVPLAISVALPVKVRCSRGTHVSCNLKCILHSLNIQTVGLSQ